MVQISSLLLDRDGTLIKDKHYLAKPSGVDLLPGVGEALGALARQGIRFFLVSNQSGIGRGMFSMEAAIACNERLAALLDRFGVRFTDMLFCPHAPENECDCRKPATGMWETLQKRHNLAAEDCLMVGDKPEDMEFGARAGLAGRALVLTGKGRATAESLGISLPLETSLLVFGAPESPKHPHLVLTGFSRLEQGIALLNRSREQK